MGKKLLQCIKLLCVACSMFFALSASAAVIESTESGGIWTRPATWVGGVVPTATDQVVINGTVSLLSSVEVAGLEVQADGVVRLYNSSNTYSIQVNGNITNNGQINSGIAVLSFGDFLNYGFMSATGTSVSLYGDEQGRVSLAGELPYTVLRNDIALFTDMTITRPFVSNSYTISAANNTTIIFESTINDDLHILGTPTVYTEAGVRNLDAPFSTAYLAGVLVGNSTVRVKEAYLQPGISLTIRDVHMITADNITIESGVQLDTIQTTSLTYNLVLNGTVVNYGSIGAGGVNTTINGHFENKGQVQKISWGPDTDGTGSITGDDFTNFGVNNGGFVDMRGDIILTEDLSSNILINTYDNTFTTLESKNITFNGVIFSSDFELVGEANIEFTGLGGYANTITAPESNVVLSGGSLRGATINAQSISITGDVQLTGNSFRNYITSIFTASNGVTVRETGRLYNNRLTSYGVKTALRVYGVLENKGTIETTVANSSDLAVTVYGSIRNTGTWIGNNISLGRIADGVEYDSVEYIRASSTALLSEVDIVAGSSLSVRDTIAGRKELYVRFRTVTDGVSSRWSDVQTVNKPFDPISVPDDFFTFDLIRDVQFPNRSSVVISAQESDFNGRVYLSANNRDVYPRVIDMIGGQWSGEVQFFEEQKNQRLVVRGGDKQGRSNAFKVTAESTAEQFGSVKGTISGFNELFTGATVQLSDERGEISTTTVFEESGTTSIKKNVFIFENVVCGEHTLTLFGPDEFIESTSYVDVVCGETVRKNIEEPLAACQPSDLVPVLLVPGMQGSTLNISLQDSYPSLPAHNPAWNSGDLKIHDPKTPLGTVLGWEELRKSFESQGYARGCNLFDVAYDWTLELNDTVDQYLKPWIDHAKTVASSTQVDIVAHSMGGLVSRAYIQHPDKYENDVRRFAMVGTPNMGSAKAFYSWNSGDPLVADFVTGSIRGQTSLDIADNFTSQTIMEIHRTRSHEDKELCSWAITSVNNVDLPFTTRYDRIISVGNEDLISSSEIKRTYVCDRERVYDFTTTNAIAIKTLLPTYASPIYNISTKQYAEVDYHENIFLKNLNYQNCASMEECRYNHPNVLLSSTTDTHLFVGILPEKNYAGDENTQSTPYQVPVRTRFSYEGIGGFNADGISMLGATYTIGDGTVPYNSVVFNTDIFGTESITSNLNANDSQNHISLIGYYANEITNYITKITD